MERYFLGSTIVVIFCALSYGDEIGVAQGKFSIDRASLSIMPIGPHTARILGRISACEYETWINEEIRESYWEWEYYRHKKDDVANWKRNHIAEPPKNANWGRDNKRYRISKQATKPQTVTYTPKHVEIDVPFSREYVYAEVSTDGQFSAVIKLDPKYYFSLPDDIQLKPGYSWYQRKDEFGFQAEHPDGDGKYGWSWVRGEKYRSISGKIWKFGTDFVYKGASTKVVGSLADCFSHVEIQVREKNTRAPVKPEITVTPIDVPSFDDIRASWRAKYDSHIAKKAEEKYGKLKRERGADYVHGERGNVSRPKHTLDFWAYRGSTYKIETVHENYYYFSSILEVDDRPNTKRTILLVEVGSKSRPDEEGHGGHIISN